MGIIDWERAAFFLRPVVTYQLSDWMCLGEQLPFSWFDKPSSTGSDFLKAVSRKMVALGCDDPKYCEFKRLSLLSLPFLSRLLALVPQSV